MRGSAMHDAGIRCGGPAFEVPPRGSTSFEAPRRLDRIGILAGMSEVFARPEPNGEMLGTYMRDAMYRGGYRAALEYYSSEECEKSDMPWHRLRAKGWLLGRLGLYGRMKGWLEEVFALLKHDRPFSAAALAPHALYRTPPLWLKTPRPVPRSADRIMTLEPVAAPCRDTGAVPDYIWTAMLILYATGPIFSHAGLGAAAFLVGAGANRPAPCPWLDDRRYDPRRGARLPGAPEMSQADHRRH